jgi:tetratricopeptide (TPR) repeat protein
MAPEQFDDVKHVDFRADVYAFGVTLYQMLTGRLPFTARAWEEFEYLHKTVQAPALDPPVTSKYDRALERLVVRCLQKDPSSRYQSFDEIRASLATIFEQISGRRVWDPPPAEPMSPQELGNKAVGLLEVGRVHEGLRILDRVLELSPGYALAWKNKALALMELNRWDEALAAFDQALDLDSKDRSVWFHRGVVLDRLERWDEALRSYEAVGGIESGWHGYSASINMSQILARLGRPDKSLSVLDAVLRGWPDDIPALVNRGTLLAVLKRPVEALAMFDRALQLDPGQSQASNQRSLTLSMLGRTAEGLTQIDLSIMWDPNDEVALMIKGTLLEELGRQEDALATYVAVTRLNPRNKSALQRLAALLAPETTGPS